MMENIIGAIVSNRTEDLIGLLRETPELAHQRFDREAFIAEIPHQLYKDDTLLHVAAAAVRLDAATRLVETGADTNAANRLGARPLHYACDPRPAQEKTWQPPEQEALVRLLLAHGAQADAPDKMGVTPLHRAARARSPGAVRALLEGGANLRRRAGKAGSTALHLAVSSTGASGTAGSAELQVEIVRLLVRHGASLSDKDGQGKTGADRIRSPALRHALADLLH